MPDIYLDSVVFFLIIPLVVANFWLVSRVPKKLILTIFASLLIALAEGWNFGVPYSATSADVPICLLNEETDSACKWSSQHLVPHMPNFKTWVLLNSTLCCLPALSSCPSLGVGHSFSKLGYHFLVQSSNNL